MSGKDAKRWRKLYKGIAHGKVDVDLKEALRRHRRIRRRNGIKNAAIILLALTNIFMLLLLLNIL